MLRVLQNGSSRFAKGKPDGCETGPLVLAALGARSPGRQLLRLASLLAKGSASTPCLGLARIPGAAHRRPDTCSELNAVISASAGGDDDEHADLLVEALIENDLRRDLDHLARACGYQRLRLSCGVASYLHACLAPECSPSGGPSCPSPPRVECPELKHFPFVDVVCGRPSLEG
jgi:hypothetical protein